MKLILRALLYQIILYSFLQAAHPKTIEMVKKIDTLVEKRLEELNLKPNPISDDTHFLRRSSLGIIGRVPTIEEAYKFFNDRKSGKRERLIDRLLDHPGYASHQTNWMTDILRAQSRHQNLQVGTSGEVFIDWIQKCFAENKPYNEFVYEMLASSGDLWDENNPAIGYYMRDYRMPQDNLSNSMQVFLGTRMQCAQCHDHPFDKWTQKNFYEIAAFINGIDFFNKEMDSKIREAAELSDTNGKDKVNRNIFTSLNVALTPGFYGEGNGHIRLPHDYSYKDHKPGDIIQAKTPFGPKVNLDYVPTKNGMEQYEDERFLKKLKKKKGGLPPVYENNNSKIEFAKWVTSKENPRFAKVIANRLWKRVMGMGLIEPIDDIRETTTPSDPELMTLLEDMIKEYDFDLKEVYRTLYYTKTFSRAAQIEDLSFQTNMGFPGPLMKRLSAEQIWDSLMALRSDDVDNSQKEKTIGRYPIYNAMANKGPRDIADILINAKNNIDKYTNKKDKIDLEQYISMNLEMEMDTNRNRQENLKQMQKDFQAKLKKELGSKPKNKNQIEAWNEKRAQLINQYKAQSVGYKVNNNPNYFRASEIRMPARPGHFLYQLGQSTKQTIEGATEEANIPQVLTLLNGLEPLIYDNQYSGIWKYLNEFESPVKKIDVLFISTLTRKPTSEEKRKTLSLIKESPQTAYQDILWVLVNTHEFKFIQ